MDSPIESSPAEKSDVDIEQINAINRFVSTFSGAFRAFFIYKEDNKAIDEIMNNLVKRFQMVAAKTPSLKLGITNMSLTFQGDPVGFQEITVYLASTLRALGFKEIILTAPVQSRHFFPLFHQLSTKDNNEVKVEKLLPLIGDGSDKPISLVPITANSIVLLLSDEQIMKRLEPIKIPKSEGGPGFIESLGEIQLHNWPDLYTFICVKANLLPGIQKAFIRSLVDATREGFFSISRFLKVFPLPASIFSLIDAEKLETPIFSPRKPPSIDTGFRPEKRTAPRPEWLSFLTAYSQKEIDNRKEQRLSGSISTILQDLELAQALMSEGGSNFTMGLRLLLRILSNKSTMATQEKALKLGILVWTKSQHLMDEPRLMALLSLLRKTLSEAHNISLVLYPLRSLSMESDSFIKLSKFIISLGDAALPSLISALDAEEERSMRKKLCHLITLIGREQGTEFIIESLPKASHFLLRNLIMILGDIKSSAAVAGIASCVGDPKKIVRAEAVRSLCKIGTDEADKNLHSVFNRVPDADLKQIIGVYFVQRKDPSAIDLLIRAAKQPDITAQDRQAAYRSIAQVGGPRAKQFLESLQKDSSFLGRFSSDEKETQNLIKSLLSRMP